MDFLAQYCEAQGRTRAGEKATFKEPSFHDSICSYLLDHWPILASSRLFQKKP